MTSENRAPETDAGRLLQAKSLTVAVAESCTGGLLGHRITSVAGSSRYFLGGIIAYSNTVKVRDLGVSSEELEAQGAVSAIVARQMAQGVRQHFGADIGIAVTGIAGPDGGTPEKPVGRVFIGLAQEGGCRVDSYQFPGSRTEIRAAAGQAALEMLVEQIKD